ncbi:histone PARylation factor 1 [Phytophthora cinnamomi]|uniref:histone PARylation factor 1 n=1 Tax=Phytophthora cinnamomi TaxID=4785 RepID=UPI0035597492|nr:histone PARylation factor 1 [Phytophthora cinnamomi]
MRRSSPRLRGREEVEATDGDAPTAAKRHKPDPSAALPAVQVATTEQWGAFLLAKYFLNVPGEFYTVFALATELRPDSPCEAFVDTLEIRLCGPFDLLAAAAKKEVAVDKPLHLHGRFFCDPPEVAAVMADTSSDVTRHWGYFRDSPDQVPEYVVCAESSRECKFDIVGGSLFQVLESALEKRRSTLGAEKATALLQTITARRGEKARSRGQSESALRAKRAKESVATSLHQLGIVVPVDSKTKTGYRELPTTGRDLADLLYQVEKDVDKKSSSRKRLSELVTRATIASDECDFGTGLLLGLDVFTAGSCLEKEALQLLRVAYMLLRRANFYKIASGHCKHRDRDDAGMSIQSIATSDCDTSDKQPKVTTVELPPSLFGSK